MTTRMVVVGTEPIGCYLARPGNDMTFVDVDQEHIAAIREKGLQVDAPDGPFNVKINIVFPSVKRFGGIAAQTRRSAAGENFSS